MKTTLKKLRVRKALVLFLVLGLGFSAFASNEFNSNEESASSLSNVTTNEITSSSYENDIESDQTLKTVTGTVTDTTGESLPGVNITVKGQTKGTQTDFDGNYSINVTDADVLVFSYVGFKTSEKAVGSTSTLNVSLEEDDTALNEVVIIGYGKTTKSDLTGAVAKVTEEQYKEQPITRTEDILQGRTAGVSLARTGGNAGAGVKIRVRGVNSINQENGPLVVVDGIFGGDLRTINPSDIASLEVLKDASALAVYGSRGANGVILVTTKKGKGKAKVNVEHFVSVSKLAKKYKGRLSSGQFANFLLDNNIPVTRTLEDGTQELFSLTENDVDFYNRNPIDHEDDLFRSAFSYNTQVSVSGGDDKINYFVSANYNDQEGIVESNEYERTSLRSNLNAKVNDKLTVGLNLYASREIEHNDTRGFARFRGGLSSRAHTFDPLTPLRDVNGDIIRTTQNLVNVNDAVNPIAALLATNDNREEDRVNANINLNYDFNDNFSYTLIGGLNTRHVTNESFKNDVSISAGVNTSVFTGHQISNILNWRQSFGDHNFNATALYELQGDELRNHNLGILDPQSPNVFIADNLVPNNSSTTVNTGGGSNSIESYMARLEYNFARNFYLTGSIRRDESSRFAKGERVGYFPSASVAYSFNNLKFVENSDVLYSAKLRGSWGRIGNQNVPSTATELRVGSIRPDDFRQIIFPFNGDLASAPNGVTPTQASAPGLTWETTETWNAGLDLGLFNGRVDFSFDYFEKVTEDLLIQDTNPITNISIFRNSAEIENKGFDISLSADVVQTENFNWNVFAVASKVKNEVTAVSQNRDFFDDGILSLDASSRIARIQVGQPLGTFVGRRYLGVNNSTEELLRADGTAIPFGASVYADDLDEDVEALEVIGNGTPEWTFGLNQTFDYKNLSLNIFLQGSAGFEVYNQARAALNGGDGPFGQNLSTNLLNVTTIDNPTNIPTDNDFNSSRWVEDGDFVRLANLSLGYTLNNPIKGVNSMNVYVSGQNLFLISDYSGYDPEGSSEGTNDRASGIDFGGVPNPRTYTMGVKLEF